MQGNCKLQKHFGPMLIQPRPTKYCPLDITPCLSLHLSIQTCEGVKHKLLLPASRLQTTFDTCACRATGRGPSDDCRLTCSANNCPLKLCVFVPQLNSTWLAMHCRQPILLNVIMLGQSSKRWEHHETLSRVLHPFGCVDVRVTFEVPQRMPS